MTAYTPTYRIRAADLAGYQKQRPWPNEVAAGWNPEDRWTAVNEGPGKMWIKLPPGGRLFAHNDLRYSDRRDRVMVVLQTNPECRWRHGADIHTFSDGDVVFFDASEEHEAWNDGSSDRITLVLCYRNPGERNRNVVADLAVEGLAW